jgi:hypothetical protein
MNCPNCGFTLKTIPAGVSKKTGKPYEAFQSCSNFQCKYTQRIGSQQNKEGLEKAVPNGNDKILLVLDELRVTNKRLDGLADFLEEKFGVK